MDDRIYSQAAARTISSEFHVDKVDPRNLIGVLGDIVAHAALLDQMKKALFYGKDIGHKVPADETFALLTFTEAEQHVAHGIIGKLTEAAELAEILLMRLQNGEGMDRVHILEEVGDDQWYSNVLLKGIDATMDEAKVLNIGKLLKRYPTKFSLELAENRNLEAERAVLEAGGSTSNPFGSGHKVVD